MHNGNVFRMRPQACCLTMGKILFCSSVELQQAFQVLFQVHLRERTRLLVSGVSNSCTFAREHALDDFLELDASVCVCLLQTTLASVNENSSQANHFHVL